MASKYHLSHNICARKPDSMFLKIFLVILTSLLNVQCDINDILPENSDMNNVNELSKCVIDIIIKNKFSKTTIDSYENSDRVSWQTSVLTEIAENLVQNGIQLVYLDVSNINQTNYINEETSFIITDIKTCKSLTDFTDIILNENNKYLIIMNEIIITECNDTLKDITGKIADYHVTFIYEDKIRNVFKTYTYINTLDAETCEFKNKTRLVHLHVCRNGSIGDNVKVFPDKKIRNWMGCPINVGLSLLFPFTKSFNKTLQSYDDIDVAEGSDVEILKIVAARFNASLKFYHINPRPKMSFLRYVHDGFLEVYAGGLYRVYGDIVSYSGVYSRQELVWVYTVERNKGSWVAFMKKTDEIYIFIIFYICYTVIWYIFCQFDKDVVSLSNTFVYAWGTLFGAASLKYARTVKQKIMNLFYLILCLHLYAYVSIELFPFLTIQGPPKEYQNTEEIAESGKTAYLIYSEKYFVDDEKYVAFANTSKSCIDFDDCIEKILINKGTTVLLDGLLAPVQVATAVNGEAKVLIAPEPILVVYHEMIIRKNSALIGRFEKIISRLLEGGICDKLYEDSIGLEVLDEARWASLNMLSNSYSCEGGCKITLSQCAGAFYAWILGSLMACCAFCAEIFMNRQVN